MPFRISVIIPTYNAGSELQQLIRKLWWQSVPPYEIVIVDSSSKDGSAQLAEREGARVLSIPQSEFDHGGTRNFAAGMARGDVLVFMTQDAIPDNDELLKELTAPLYIEETACVYARQLARDEATVLEQLARLYNYPPESQVKEQADIPQLGLKTFFCSNVCSAVRKEMFVDSGRFPEPVIFNEDLFFAAACVLRGYKIVYAADARVIHSHDYTLKQQFKRFFDNGVSMRRHDWIYQYAAVGGEGLKMVRMMLKELARKGQWLLVPKLIAESAAKFLGYQLGKRYNKLPRALCVRFSMHRKIWDKLDMKAQSTNVAGHS
ncbi:glycosyltransferase family 2 protein [Paenibacillus sp. GCM10027626]|uniref:glycosyltransferase family 2 protein n=1 Tax=Paenibacillus sp. GCM10027626 TaxID=3273411 RepID=UPI00363B1FB2